MKIGNQIKIAALAILFALAPIAAVRAEPEIHAEVSSTEVDINSSLNFSVQVSGIGDVDSPNLSLPDFQVQSAGRTQSFQWVNGQTSSMVTFNYILTPTKTGALTIPSISLKHGDHVYSTKPIKVTVNGDSSGGNKKSAAAPAPAAVGGESVAVPSEGLRPVFMTASVDKSKAYVGQQIMLKVQFLRRPNVSFAAQPRYSEPDMTGFVVEPLKQQEYSTSINGIPYSVTELRYALFPTSDGEFAIGNAHIELAVRTPGDPFDPNSLFQSFFGQAQAVKLDTRAIPIQVRSLPKNKPDNFSGAVGRYKITAKVDTTTPEVGKPLNLILTVDGVGNIKSLKEPVVPEIKSFRRYETISASKVNNEGKFIYGSKEFKILLIPQVSGQITIPSIPFVYFNPDDHDFDTEETSPITLSVKPGTVTTGRPETQPVASGPDNSSEEGIRVVEKDIRFLKTGPLAAASAPLYAQGSFLVLLAFPPVFALAAALAGWQTRRRSVYAAHFRSKEAYRNALKALKVARKNAGQPETFYGTIHDSITGFLAAKLGGSASGLVWEEVERKLIEKGATTDVIRNVRDVFDEADMARFATSAFANENKEASLQKAHQALDELNKIL